MLQIDWVSMHFQVIRQRVESATSEKEARDTKIQLVDKFEQDNVNTSFFQQAKFLYATKIKGEACEQYEDPYISIGQAAKNQF